MNTESQQPPSGRRKVQVGDRAPAFSLQTQTGATASLQLCFSRGFFNFYICIGVCQRKVHT